MERIVKVDLGERSYSVRIGAGILDDVGAVVATMNHISGAVIVSDTHVAPLYASQIKRSLENVGLSARLLQFNAGESSKTLQTYSGLMDQLLGAESPIDRDTVVIALGGGVVGDVAGFVAATALRGLRFLQCPTTLLANVDSSVGGKTGVDHAAGKNLIGAFHQPRGVLIDVLTLKSLPRAELGNGFAEGVKHGAIRDVSLLDFVEGSAAALLNAEPDVMCEFIERNVAIKAAVVAADERESGVRAHLNFGHTIGHAIETWSGYEETPHGRAVALGMIAANAIAVGRGLIDGSDAQRIRRLLERLELPVRVEKPLVLDEIWSLMQRDKKARGGKVRMVLPTSLGAVDVYDDITREDVQVGIDALK